MAATVNMVIHFRAKAGKEDEFKTLFTSLLAPTRLEAGCMQYDLLQDKADPTRFCVVERWASPETLQAHIAGADLQATLGKCSLLFDGPPQAGQYDLI